MKRIYLDNNASTALDFFVLQKVVKALQEELGNPSSIHLDGQFSRQKINTARESIASFLGVRSQEIIFTSGGTEGANYLIQGFKKKYPSGHIITSVAEHPCVYKSLQELQKEGRDVTFLPVGLEGAVTPEAVIDAIKPATQLIMLMAVNNETGVKTDVHAIAKIAEERNIPFFVDGVCWLGKESISIPKGVSAIFFSGHKCHAPKGVGFIYLRSTMKLSSLIVGGNQELTKRAGTENLSGIVGIGAAVELLKRDQHLYTEKMREMRDHLEKGLQHHLDDIVINGRGDRVVNTSNISFSGVDGESLLILLDKEISVSHGSACSSGAIEPSRILLQMGLPLSEARSALRFSVSRFTTIEEINRCIELVCSSVRKLRNRS